VLAAILPDPQHLLPLALARGLTPEHFAAPDLRILFSCALYGVASGWSTRRLLSMTVFLLQVCGLWDVRAPWHSRGRRHNLTTLLQMADRVPDPMAVCLGCNRLLGVSEARADAVARLGRIRDFFSRQRHTEEPEDRLSDLIRERIRAGQNGGNRGR